MKTQIRSIGVVLSVLFAGVANAQVSGVPGDGIPDLYYFQADGLTATTSAGPVSRPGGTLLLDSDGFDIVAVLVGGPNVSTAPLGCDLCDNQQLPTGALAGGTFTVGFAGFSSQWIRTAPLTGQGFDGVIGSSYRDAATNQMVMGWPPDFPPFLTFTTRKEGLARYVTGLDDADFIRGFDDGTTEALWSIRVGADSGADLFTNVTVLRIPEPTSGLLGFAGLVLMGMIRRRLG